MTYEQAQRAARHLLATDQYPARQMGERMRNRLRAERVAKRIMVLWPNGRVQIDI